MNAVDRISPKVMSWAAACRGLPRLDSIVLSAVGFGDEDGGESDGERGDLVMRLQRRSGLLGLLDTMASWTNGQVVIGSAGPELEEVGRSCSPVPPEVRRDRPGSELPVPLRLRAPRPATSGPGLPYKVRGSLPRTFLPCSSVQIAAGRLVMKTWGFFPVPPSSCCSSLRRQTLFNPSGFIPLDCHPASSTSCRLHTSPNLAAITFANPFFLGSTSPSPERWPPRRPIHPEPGPPAMAPWLRPQANAHTPLLQPTSQDLPVPAVAPAVQDHVRTGPCSPLRDAVSGDAADLGCAAHLPARLPLAMAPSQPDEAHPRPRFHPGLFDGTGRPTSRVQAEAEGGGAPGGRGHPLHLLVRLVRASLDLPCDCLCEPPSCSDISHLAFRISHLASRILTDPEPKSWTFTHLYHPGIDDGGNR